MDISKEIKALPADPPRHRILEDIAHELSSDVVFPTGFETVRRLHAALEDPEIGLVQISALIAVDPLVSARILGLANSVAYNPGGAPVQTLHLAIERLGLNNVRLVALAVANRQLLLSREANAFRALGDRLWRQSLHTASAAHVLARRLTRVHPDEAMLAGLIHNIGAFYMISCGSRYPDLVSQPDALLRLLADWHESIGHTLAITLGLPQNLADAILDQDAIRDWPDPILSLHDIVYVAHHLAGGTALWTQEKQPSPTPEAGQLQDLLDRFGDDIDTHHRVLTSVLA